MPEPLVPLSVAFIWHMHQPEYKDRLTGDYLMPWVRLHAIKDYLDMVVLLDKYPAIRQTFNLVPSLIDQLEDYCHPDTRDRHMDVMLRETLTEADKQFILQRGFDAAAQTMIAKSPYYYDLFERRNASWLGDQVETSAFTDQELHDITALFNLVWFDPLWFKENPELYALWEKQQAYTLADRTRIIELQRALIARVLPTYKAFQERGQIEVTTTPYYHPILPLLLDSNAARIAMPGATLPEESFQFENDARYHVQHACQKYLTLFDRPPAGIWPSEQSISPDTLRLIGQYNFQWAVSSEGNLSRSLGVPIERDPFGNVLNVEVFCKPYRFADVTLLFRNLTLSDLIGFHYASMPPSQAAQDLYTRIKELQKRCTQAGMTHPIVTIALDGENCWEAFPEDGHPFLEALYTLLSNDASLHVCRVQDYLRQVPPAEIPELSYLHSGSWINSDFHIWIGDPVKNAAWMYLKRTRTDLLHFAESGLYSPTQLAQAWDEIYVAEGSDWFWWYGEPHNSGQDDVFDMQFRRHLANVYRILHLEIPSYLDVPLTMTMGRPVTVPTANIQPRITGILEDDQKWAKAGCFDLTHGAMHRSTRILKRIYYGCDAQHLYLRLDLNAEALTPYHDIFLYFCTPGKTRHNSPIRIKSTSGHTTSLQRYLFAYEIQLSHLFPGRIQASGAEALPDHLWFNRPDLVESLAYTDVVEMAIPFERLNICPGEPLQFALALVQGGVLEEFQPENFALSLQRMVPETDATAPPHAILF